MIKTTKFNGFLDQKLRVNEIRVGNNAVNATSITKILGKAIDTNLRFRQQKTYEELKHPKA